jgi:ketosteroid isomerase-like protein
MSGSTTEETRRIVTAYAEALRTRDLDTLRKTFAPDATWRMLGSLPVSGTWHGPEGILDGFLTRMFARLDPTAPVSQEVHRIIADGEYAVAEWTSHARSADGRDYDNDYAIVFRVSDGHIAGVTEYTDTSHMADVLFSH